MVDANLPLPPPLEAARAAGRVPGISAASPMQRRLLVAATLVGADLVSGLAAAQIAGIVTGATFKIGMGALPALIVVYWALGLYGGFGPLPYERLRLRAQGIGLLGLADFVTNIMVSGVPRPGFLALACVLLLVVGYYLEIYARTVLIRRGMWGGTAMVVGAGRGAGQLARYLQAHPECGLRPVGFVCTAQEDKGQMPPSLPALGGIADLEHLVPSEVLLYRSAECIAAVSPSLRRRLNAKQMVMVGDSDGLPSLWLRTRSLGGLIGVELRRDGKKWNRRCKRLVDLIVAAPASLLAAPVIALAAVAIKLADPGPAFYVQDRVGMDGRTFRVCKLRTMFTDAEQRLLFHLAADPQARAEWHQFFKLRRDPRILPVVGALLRRTSLDELPQLWHVLRGQMSLVGPRPFPAYHISSFDREFQAIRCSVPPGLSGLWQVAARSNGDLEVQRAQDLFYILNWSIWLDFYVLIETPVAVIAARGAR
jgi:Undecaprenyl-phosphate galactose phosphotransferase WbaP